MNRITYDVDDRPTATELADVFRRSGIRRPVDDLARMGEMIENADLLLTARVGARLIGVARALTDWSYCCYLSDLAVDLEFQKQGIGRHLVEMLRARLDDRVMVLLLAAPEAAEYYPKLGFEHVPNGWMLQRKR